LPRFPIWDDVRTFDGKPWCGQVDIVAGGFPCQDISCAGKGEGITGSRSGLWSEMARIIGEVRPRYAFVENSPMLVGRGLVRVLGDLAEMGYDARWCCLGSSSTGGYQGRERMWILANTDQISNCDERARWTRRDLHTRSGNTCKQWNVANENKKRKKDPENEGPEGGPKPRLVRLADEVANRMERISCAGNGQDPIVAATAWRILRG
jgi:DNA (cytosine-5)-methyltransferase 1